MKSANQIRITEIFKSIQGESDTLGWPTVFIRLTGCPLRCQYCDTAYAFKGGVTMQLDDILQKTESLKAQYVCVTGGEPLAQKACLLLLSRLCDAGYKVSIETSGALPIEGIDKRVMIVMDIKTPDSKEQAKNLWENLNHLKPSDQVKFVICSENDYQWAKSIVKTYQLTDKAQVLFSPSYDEINATTLADWIVRDHLNVRFQLQLHKILWQDAPGH
jgi:7-carboxy-7-deazaguanine synthase